MLRLVDIIEKMALMFKDIGEVILIVILIIIGASLVM